MPGGGSAPRSPRRQQRYLTPALFLSCCLLLLRLLGDPTASPGATGGNAVRLAAASAAGDARAPHAAPPIDAASAWRSAEAARQAALRRVALLREQVRARSPAASDARKAAFGSGATPRNATREDLRAQLAAEKRLAAALALDATRAARGLAPGWGAARAADAAAAGPAASAAAASAAQGLPLLTQLPAPGASLNVTFILHYDAPPTAYAADVSAWVDGLLGCARGVPSELLVGVAAPGAAGAWEAAALRTAGAGGGGGGAFVTPLLTPNATDIEGACALACLSLLHTHTRWRADAARTLPCTAAAFSRGAALARGALLVLLRASGGTPPQHSCAWVADLLSAFAAWPRLGGVAHAGGSYWWPPALGDAKHAAAPVAAPLFADPVTGLPFEFVTAMHLGGPVALRAAALRAVGGLQARAGGGAACSGVGSGSGSGADAHDGHARARAAAATDAGAELSLRLWVNGWFVARMAPPLFEPAPATANAAAASGSAAATAAAADAACAALAAHLEREAAVRRYPERVSRAALRHVVALNGRLQRRFQGAAPWEHAWWRGGLGLAAAGGGAQEEEMETGAVAGEGRESG